MTRMQTRDDGAASFLDVEQAVKQRYSNASQQAEPSLCCPVQYDDSYLEVLPRELIERDYGCGNPSAYVESGETVLDLGSGGGKICYIASQIVGPAGRVLGVDMNDDMLGLARRYQQQISQAIGWDNVQFFKGRIQDLALDLDALDAYLAEHPVGGAGQWMELQRWTAQQRTERPMIADDSVDVVLSNCVLNLVRPEDRRQLFAEVFRVLRRGGRAVISDIVCDEPVPDYMRRDAKLWSGCISGAFLEDEFLKAFEEAGFYGVELITRQQDPWAVVDGIEFRSVTVRALKGKQGPCREHYQAVIYRGPWKSVTDDDGHTLRRGVRTAVCDKTYQILNRAPYADQVFPVPPQQAVDPDQAQPFDCCRSGVREAQETKRGAPARTILPTQDCCGPNDCC